MSQINFSIGMHDIAVDYITRAIDYSKSSMPQYLIWKAIFLYFIFINSKSDASDKASKTSTHYLNWEWAALAAEKAAPESIAINFLILKLSIEKISLMRNHKGLSSSVLRAPNIYASKIMKINKYMGYLGWVEVYLKDKTKQKLANDVLYDLMNEYPKNPHAFLRKWK